MKKIIFAVMFVVAAILHSEYVGNKNKTFSQAKKLLLEKVYFDHHETFYCKAKFDDKGNVTLPAGFETKKHKKRSSRIEWEHAIPAENFGRVFEEWRNGHKKCVTSQGKKFSGRKCAEKVNPLFARMQADMYNLYPAIGSVNALRSNYNYAEIGNSKTAITFGICPMKIDGRKAEPPAYTKGAIARTYLYFEKEYSVYKMSNSQRKLMQAWDKMYPVDKWECQRNKRIEILQKNENTIVKEACLKAGL